MIQIRKEDNQKKQKEKKLKVYKVNTHKKTVIALWVLLAVSFLFAVYKNFTAIDIHTVHETKVIEETILDTHKIENFVENFAEVYYSWEQSAASIDNRRGRARQHDKLLQDGHLRQGPEGSFVEHRPVGVLRQRGRV